MLQSANELIQVLQKFDLIKEDYNQACTIIKQSLQNNGKLLLCGNGGSAAEAQHIAAEYVSSLQHHIKRAAIPAIALSTDTSIITAAANDFGFDIIFERQVEALGSKGDVLIALSISGNSKNVIKAIKKAKEKSLKIIGITGENGGEMHLLCDTIIKIPSQNTQRIQEISLLLQHNMVAEVENEMIKE